MEIAQIDFGGIQSSAGLNLPTNLGGIVTKITPYIFASAGIILLLNLLWGGISLMLTQGDPKAIEAAKAKITTSLIGFIIIFVAYWLVQILATVFRLETVRSIFG